MATIHKHSRLMVVAVSCAVIGAGASTIARAGASTNAGSSTTSAHPARDGLLGRRWLARAVHGDIVVAARTGFVTVSFDRGVVQSVNGQQLTLIEGTKRTNKTVALTIPTDAHVRDNGKSATLADLKSGQRAIVWNGTKRTLVIAHNRRSH